MPIGGLRLAFITGLLTAFLTACSSPPDSMVTPLHRSTVLIEHDEGHGSGLIVGPRRVLTAHHVVQGEGLGVRFFSGEANAGSVIWSDAERDLALIDVEIPEGHPKAPLSCDHPVAGQHVIAVGHPIQSQWVMVGGYLPNRSPIAGRLVSLGFPVGLGTSGGPVFDDQGRVIGITLAILAERSSTEAAYDEFKDTGIGLMLPSSNFCKTVGVPQ
ncbi:MAG: serine protease [Pseudomonadota bacterium]